MNLIKVKLNESSFLRHLPDVLLEKVFVSAEWCWLMLEIADEQESFLGDRLNITVLKKGTASSVGKCQINAILSVLNYDNYDHANIFNILMRQLGKSANIDEWFVSPETFRKKRFHSVTICAHEMIYHGVSC